MQASGCTFKVHSIATEARAPNQPHCTTHVYGPQGILAEVPDLSRRLGALPSVPPSPFPVLASQH
eukprot:7007318-Lingulodinium_polyedra.AAC.1